MSSPVQIKSQAVAQDTFPSAFIEPEWSRVNIIRDAPQYALRYVLGAHIIASPRGRIDYVQMNFEGMVYCLHVNNFKIVQELAVQLTQKLIAAGHLYWTSLRHKPNIIIDSMHYLSQIAIGMFDVPLSKTKMLWLVPDLGACGYYRSKLPHKYLKSANSDYHTEISEFANYDSISWFDTLVLHRSPPEYVLSIYQNLKAAGKTIIYEFDDDLFSIPEWNHNQTKLDKVALDRARTAIEMSDLIICSTDQLKEVSNRPDIAMVGPNLIDFSSGNFEPLKCNRQLNEEWVGYAPRYVKDKLVYWHKGKELKFSAQSLDPIRILWTGSNTHDQDLDEVVPTIKRLSDEFGISVVFIFFGYCPNEFLEVVSMAGNTKPKFEVKQEWIGRIHFIEGVPFGKYMQTLREINPDFALCPLTDHPFNLSKSPLKVLELGSLGIPVIASYYGPYADLKPHIVHTYVDEQLDWNEAIKQLITHNERNQLGFRAQEEIYKNYSWQNESEQRDKWDDIFADIHNLVQSKRKELYERISSELECSEIHNEPVNP